MKLKDERMKRAKLCNLFCFTLLILVVVENKQSNERIIDVVTRDIWFQILLIILYSSVIEDPALSSYLTSYDVPDGVKPLAFKCGSNISFKGLLESDKDTYLSLTKGNYQCYKSGFHGYLRVFWKCYGGLLRSSKTFYNFLAIDRHSFWNEKYLTSDAVVYFNYF